MMNRKIQSGKAFTGVGLLLIAAAFLLAGKNLIDISKAQKASMEILTELRPEVEDARESFTADEYVPDHVLDPDMEMPKVSIHGNMYIGILSIPDIGIELPVMENWSYPNLKLAPCRYSGTIYKGDMVICAHNYGSHFGNLRFLSPGSIIIFTDINGYEFNYEIVETEILKPTAIEEMTSGKCDLTLFTCTSSGAARVTVRCIRK